MYWSRKVIPYGEEPSTRRQYDRQEDELHGFGEMSKRHGDRAAILVQVDDVNGILYPLYSRILSFNPTQSGEESIDLRVLEETLTEGMFIIMPIVGDVDLGGSRATHGHFSQLWITRLEQEFRTDGLALIMRLKNAGLDLMHLGSALKRWCRPPSTVIHAPKEKRDFQILWEVLDIPGGRAACQQAWDEVRRSRGEAIQTGFQEQDIIDEELRRILILLLPQIRERIVENIGFHLDIPDEFALRGYFLFLKIIGIEEGFQAPDNALKFVYELGYFDQWRN
jgi:hypothetical protein